jgi:hypothetical protein
MGDSMITSHARRDDYQPLLSEKAFFICGCERAADFR